MHTNYLRIIGKRWLAALLVLPLLASACGAAAWNKTSSATASAAAMNGGLPLAMKLCLGIFKLEETGTPLDAAQAAALLPLWKAARALGKSQTTAQEEIDGLLKQIQGNLTPEQMSAIEAMNLGPQDMRSVGQKFGLELGGGSNGRPGPAAQVTRQTGRSNNRQDFGGPGGMFGGGGGQPPNQPTARSASRGASLQMNTALLDALIKFLQEKVQ